MTDIAGLIRSAKRPRTTVTICLDGELQQQWDDLHDQLTRAAVKATRVAEPSLADLGEAAELTEQIELLEEQLSGRQITFGLEAMSHTDYRMLVDDHPPRPDHDVDKSNGFNVATLFPVLVRVCTVEPVLDDDDWDLLLEALSSGQFDSLVTAALVVNRRKVSVPFSSTVSTKNPNFDGS